jgi:hypothetical protein
MNFVRFFLIGFLISLIGCSSEVPNNLGKRALVKGSVTLRGKPAFPAYIVFSPVEAGRGEEQSRELSKTGKYALSVFPGKYKVSLQGNRSVPAKYSSSKTTDKNLMSHQTAKKV